MEYQPDGVPCEIQIQDLSSQYRSYTAPSEATMKMDRLLISPPGGPVICTSPGRKSTRQLQPIKVENAHKNYLSNLTPIKQDNQAFRG